MAYLLLLSTAFAQPSLNGSEESGEANSKRMRWWTDARFGMFIHWGLYSYTAGEWKGRPAKGGEHFMLHERIPWKEYAHIADSFSIPAFDADKMVLAAKQAGMKYIVVTAKHHDGFAMYDSPSSDYNIVKLTPYAKDPMKELASACVKHGLVLGFYYSLGRDWQDPDVPTNWPTRGGRSNTWDYPDEDKKDLAKYFERKVKPQVKELLTQYGKVGVMWFDTYELITKAQSAELRNLIHSIQPDCIINNRIGHGFGDYKVTEQEIIKKAEANPWEACVTMSRNWGYNRYDTVWKSPGVLVRQLVEAVSKGGNYLLNVGPMPDGSLPPQSTDRLAALGQWMRENQEAIYGSRPWKIEVEKIDGAVETARNAQTDKAMTDAVNDATSKSVHPEIRFTAKENTVYVFANGIKTSDMLVKAMGSRVSVRIKSVELLGSNRKTEWRQKKDGLLIQLPAKKEVAVIPVRVYKVKLDDGGGRQNEQSES